MILLDSFPLGGNSGQRLISGDALKRTLSSGSLPLERVQHAIRRIYPLPQRAPPHACPELRFWAIVGFNSRNPSVFNMHFKQARPSTMCGAYRRDNVASGLLVTCHGIFLCPTATFSLQ